MVLTVGIAVRGSGTSAPATFLQGSTAVTLDVYNVNEVGQATRTARSGLR